ncbi:carbohydrate kinase family protein [Deinococcus sp. QL22]|uniref:carbohydrate kinase family protein n=1 Tax=Deinococcus sp. QL22 TaxID=2939437 RepID=UPI0020180FBC|nr:carbohydrate kinase family protein [Deinococcus sp. QL22]UQN05714.1 carbohydrate kinase family protein [Deinococcus sp. QL22]
MSSSPPLRVLVAGNTNAEFHLEAPVLPLPDVENTAYSHGLTLGVSGVGFNVAHALARLGADPGLLTFAGNDPAGELLRATLAFAFVCWTRPLLPLAREAGVPIVTDLQATPGPAHPYDQPFLAHADVLLLSAEYLTMPPLDALRAYRQRCDPAIIVISLGAEGALMSERGQAPHHQLVVPTRPVVSTNGAGDTLLSAFVWAYFGGYSAREALRLACTFAS